jgi:hypothetical protein
MFNTVGRDVNRSMELHEPNWLRNLKVYYGLERLNFCKQEHTLHDASAVIVISIFYDRRLIFFVYDYRTPLNNNNPLYLIITIQINQTVKIRYYIFPIIDFMAADNAHLVSYCFHSFAF